MYTQSYAQITTHQLPTLTPYSYVPIHTATVPQLPLSTHGYHSGSLALHVTNDTAAVVATSSAAANTTIQTEPAQYVELQPRAPSPINMYTPKLASQPTSTSSAATTNTNSKPVKPTKPRAPRSPRTKKPRTNGDAAAAPPSASVPAPPITSQPAQFQPQPLLQPVARPVPILSNSVSTASNAKPNSKQVLTSSNTHIVIQTGNSAPPAAPAAVTTLGNTTVALRTSTSNFRCMGCGKTYPIGQSVEARGEYCSPFCQQNPKPPPAPPSPGKRRGRPPRSGPPQPKPGKPPAKHTPSSTANNAPVQRVIPPASGPHPLTSRPGARIAKSVTNLTWNIDEYISKQNAVEAVEALFPHVRAHSIIIIFVYIF